MTRRMPRPEDVSRDHIDAAVMGFLKGEKEADWTEVSLVTLAPSRGDSCRPPGKPGTIPNRERGTLSPAPRPSKTSRSFPTCRLQVGFGGGRAPWLDTGAGGGSRQYRRGQHRAL